MSEKVWTDVCEFNLATAEFPAIVEVEEEEIAIFKVGDSFHGVQRWCPHKTADLSRGTLLGKMIKCPMHGYIFRFDDGKGINCVGIHARVYEIRFDADRLQVRKVG